MMQSKSPQEVQEMCGSRGSRFADSTIKKHEWT
jgi:hypothetical protein